MSESDSRSLSSVPPPRRTIVDAVEPRSETWRGRRGNGAVAPKTRDDAESSAVSDDDPSIVTQMAAAFADRAS